VLEHRSSAPGNREQRREGAVDERRLAVEDVDSGSVTSPWISSGMPIALHRLERRMDVADVGDAVAELVVAWAG
jgi:hypothetical protein